MPGIGELAKDAKLKNGDVKAVFTAIVQRIKNGETVSIQGLGNFKLMDRKATTARNPRTGARFNVGPSKRVKFTASKTLRDEVNGRAPAVPATAPAPAATPTP